jgi:ribonuclease HI
MTVEVFCDGACLGNPGPGGYAALLRTTTPSGTHEKTVSGNKAATTNNQMELQAAIAALTVLTRKCSVVVTTDSQYVIKGMTEWMPGWIKRGWKNSKNQPVENRALWEELAAQAAKHDVTFKWVKGHSGHPENERVDQLARDEAIRAQAAR